MYLRVASHWGEQHFVVSEWSNEVMYANTFGVALDCGMRLMVILVCDSSQSHKLGGKSSDTLASTPRKWALKLRMAASAAFCLWHPGGTNSMLNLCVLRM